MSGGLRSWTVALVVVASLALGCRRQEPPPPPPKPNIILVTIDTLRADHVSSYGYERVTTPFLDSFATEGARFTNCYATSSWTAPSMASIFTGLYSYHHGVRRGAIQEDEVRNQELLAEQFVTLAEVLDAGGYRTFGISSNQHVAVETGMAQGFQRFVELGFVDAPVVQRAAEDLVEELQGDTPYFLWVHYIDPHVPYDARSPWLDDFTVDRESARAWEGRGQAEMREKIAELKADPAAVQALIDLYDGEIRYTDAYLRKLFASLPVADDDLVIITSDHGEAFLEHGHLGHGRTVHQELIRVPLVIRSPRRAAAVSVVDAPVSILDIYPTILEHAELPVPEGQEGMSLVGLLEGEAGDPDRPLLSEHDRGRVLKTLIRGRWKLIENSKKDRMVFLFDIEADPGEKNNQLRYNRDLALEMRQELRAWKAARPAFEAPTAADELTAEEEALLRELGYIED